MRKQGEQQHSKEVSIVRTISKASTPQGGVFWMGGGGGVCGGVRNKDCNASAEQAKLSEHEV